MAAGDPALHPRLDGPPADVFKGPGVGDVLLVHMKVDGQVKPLRLLENVVHLIPVIIPAVRVAPDKIHIPIPGQTVQPVGEGGVKIVIPGHDGENIHPPGILLLQIPVGIDRLHLPDAVAVDMGFQTTRAVGHLPVNDLSGPSLHILPDPVPRQALGVAEHDLHRRPCVGRILVQPGKDLVQMHMRIHKGRGHQLSRPLDDQPRLPLQRGTCGGDFSVQNRHVRPLRIAQRVAAPNQNIIPFHTPPPLLRSLLSKKGEVTRIVTSPFREISRFRLFYALFPVQPCAMTSSSSATDRI